MPWSESQKKAILKLDPKATFSEDDEHVQTGLDYEDLSYIHNFEWFEIPRWTSPAGDYFILRFQVFELFL